MFEEFHLPPSLVFHLVSGFLFERFLRIFFLLARTIFLLAFDFQIFFLTCLGVFLLIFENSFEESLLSTEFV